MTRALAVVLLVGASAFGTLFLGCSLAVDTDELTAGDAGLDCAPDEKICPVSLEDAEGPRRCVSTTNPTTGCAASSCRPCEVPGAKGRCTSGGACGVSICLDGYDDCDGREDNGCEVHTDSDEDNCGTCGAICSIEPKAISTCIEGTCEFVSCLPGYGDCDESLGNGCEVDLGSSELHCGECNAPCNGECVGGTCT